MNQLSGILIIDKPAGWTSFDVVAKARKILGVRKIGHAGTLDPMATGVLVLLVGSATKRSDQFLNQEKVYRATIKFGQKTDTGDAEGTLIQESEAGWLTEADIELHLPALVGTRPQQVPAYSAVKVRGKKLYQLARSGQDPTDRPVKTITIHQITLNSFDPNPPTPVATITVKCSKGTYIRVLAEELAEQLGTHGHLTALRRLQSGQFRLDDAISLEQFQTAADPAKLLRPA